MASPIVIGVLKVTLHLPESGSLKTKRQLLRSLLRRVRDQFQVAAAEVGEHDRWQLAELAFVAVTTASSHADAVLASVFRYVEDHAGDAVVTDVRTELMKL